MPETTAKAIAAIHAVAEEPALPHSTEDEERQKLLRAKTLEWGAASDSEEKPEKQEDVQMVQVELPPEDDDMKVDSVEPGDVAQEKLEGEVSAETTGKGLAEEDPYAVPSPESARKEIPPTQVSPVDDDIPNVEPVLRADQVKFKNQPADGVAGGLDGRRRPKAKGKAKAKAKAEAEAKKDGETEVKEGKSGSTMKRPAARKSKVEVASISPQDEAASDPPSDEPEPKTPKVEEGVVQRGTEKEKRTFAGRPAPKTQQAFDRFTALKAVFQKQIQPRLSTRQTSAMEAWYSLESIINIQVLYLIVHFN